MDRIHQHTDIELWMPAYTLTARVRKGIEKTDKKTDEKHTKREKKK